MFIQALPWLATLVALFATYIYHRQFRSAEARAKRLVVRSRSIVKFTFFGSETPLEHRLTLRALDNERLVTAFGIENSLTTADKKIHQHFLREASKYVNLDGSRWPLLYQSAEAFVRSSIVQDLRSSVLRAPRGGVHLARLVRQLCFRTGVEALFGPDAAARLLGPDVHVITEDINRLWVESKGSRVSHSSAGLRAMLDKAELMGPASGDKALALIIPGYETLWRVVLLSFVHAYHRSPDHRLTTARAVDVPACLSHGTPDALKIAKEGLRLYPSSKRIYRAASLADNSKRVAADVEQCHRDPTIWGPDALDFKPERFDGLTEWQKEAYFPFGLAPHLCPAARGFGERLVTLLVVALGRLLPCGEYRVHFEDAALDGDRGAPLPTGRMDMEGWYVAAGRVQGLSA